MPLEAALLQDLKHDCIVNLLQHRFVKGACSEQQLWLVMEFCDKGPLDVRFWPMSASLLLCNPGINHAVYVLISIATALINMDKC